MTRALFFHHPKTKLADLFFVEDERSESIVSSLCLIPWTWRFEDVEICAGEMGIVGTSETFRRRGLVRAQVRHLKHRLEIRGCLISHIQGTPYYYRQFGYEYALPLEGGLRLELRDIPEPVTARFGFRLATEVDVPKLKRLYDDASRALAIHAVRDEPTWQYLLAHAVGTETECERWIVESAGQHVAGYFALPRHHFGDELTVSEVSPLGYDAALATLQHLKRLTVERSKPGIRLNLPADCTLMRLARSLGARDLGTYQWQVHIPSPARLLHALAPVFERRVAESPFSGMTRDLHLSLYRETILLRFGAGKLGKVTRLGFTDGEPVCVPPLQFVPLVLGFRTIAELEASYPDVRVAPGWRMLVDVLFPKVESFLCTTY